jgi:hypothetical protein
MVRPLFPPVPYFPMETLTIECDVTAERSIVLRLPASVQPGRHRIAVIINPVDEGAVDSPLSPVAEDAEPRTALWQRISALRRQAEQNGELPEPMSWDKILAATRQCRGLET